MELAINRGPNHESCCLGDFFIDDVFECYSLEPLVREIEDKLIADWKIDYQTAIPRGRYPVTIDKVNRFNREMIRILNVPGFESVQIAGDDNTEGADGLIQVGLQRTDDTIRNCSYALNVLFARIKEAIESGDKIWITLR